MFYIVFFADSLIKFYVIIPTAERKAVLIRYGKSPYFFALKVGSRLDFRTAVCDKS